ncbi:MAG: VCBS repeat-containing protein [Ignavibacteriae bacterium]|nr:VCBS repeat-containing protein [Ignavibacteriota bacterium]
MNMQPLRLVAGHLSAMFLAYLTDIVLAGRTLQSPRVIAIPFAEREKQSDTSAYLRLLRPLFFLAITVTLLLLFVSSFGFAQVVSVSPAQNALNIKPDTSITVYFSTPINPSTVNDTTSFLVYGSVSGRHRGSFAFSNNDSIVTFTTSAPFKKGEMVTVDLSNKIRTSANVPISPFIFRFTIVVSPSTGNYRLRKDYATGHIPTSVYVSDINGDGYSDIMTGNRGVGSPSVSVLKNNGDGTFAPKVNYDIAGYQSDVAVSVSDIDHDGDGDIVALINSATGSSNIYVTIWKNRGDGIFEGRSDYSWVGVEGESHSIYISDIDGDGDGDLLLTNFHNGSPPNQIVVLKNDGNGIFSLSGTYDRGAGSQPWSVYVGDVDNDGDEDIAVAINNYGNSGANIAVLRNNGTGSFALIGNYARNANGATSVFVSDLDADHYLDLVSVSDISAQVSTFKNNGDTTFGSSVNFPTTGGQGSAFVSDIDGDGDGDIITSNGSVLRNNSGTFTETDFYNLNGSTLYLSDVDEDGDADLIVTSSSSDTVSVLKNIAHDVGVEAIVVPLGELPKDTVVNPVAIVRNFSLLENSVLVKFVISSFYAESVVVPLPAFASDTLIFPAWTASVIGTHAIECVATVTGDEDTTNNMQTGSVVVLGPLPTPVILNVTPSRNGNTRFVTVTITGRNFQPGARVKLARTGQPDIVADSSSIQVIDSTQIIAAFDFLNAEPGYWDVVVSNPDNQQATFFGGFLIDVGIPKLWVDIVGRSQVRNDRMTPFWINFGNSGNANTFDAILLIKLPLGFSYKVNLPAPDTSGINWQSVPQGAVLDNQIVIPVWVYSIPAASLQRFSVSIKPPQGMPAHTFFDVTSELWLPEQSPFSWTGNFKYAGGSSLTTVLTNIYSHVQKSYPDSLLMSALEFSESLPLWLEVSRNKIQLLPICFLTLMAIKEITSMNLSDTLIRALCEQTPIFIDSYIYSDVIDTVSPAASSSQKVGEQEMVTMNQTNFPPVDVQKFKQTSEWEAKRWKCKGGGYRDPPHLGVDYGAGPGALGDPVFSMTGGQIAFIGDLACGGKTVCIWPDLNQCSICYMHLNSIDVRGRNTISAGERIGSVGNTGSCANGKVHLHIQLGLGQDVRICGDPLRALPKLMQLEKRRWPPYDPDTGPKDCEDPPKGGKHPENVTSNDPNDKVGRSGYGPRKLISLDAELPYVIFFENVDTASAEAQEVFITDTLSRDKVEFHTLSFGPITFGDTIISPPQAAHQFTTDVDLRPRKNLIVRISGNLDITMGVLSWRFRSLDPVTGQPPDSGGFLPPNVNSPEGEGSVSFSIMPKSNLVTGSEIRNKASIVFDVNPPMLTAEWLNTIDNSKPRSSVLPFAPIQDSIAFLVSWSGSDTGSGIQDYSIYVSEDTGSFTLWLQNTTETVATFYGIEGKKYSFYSVARDNAGNVELLKTTADASTTVPYFYYVRDRWNLVSVPQRVDSFLKTNLFPTAITRAFAYVGSYVEKDTLANGVGYWLKFDQAQLVGIIGQPITNDTIVVANGWNLIGSITDSVTTNQIVSEPAGIITSSFFGYRGGYVVASSIQPAQGYWVKTNDTGKIILSSTGFASKQVQNKYSIESLNQFSRIIIDDASGDQQTLWFGKRPQGEFSLQYFDMPPTPPIGVFDARFKSQRMLEVIEEGKSWEFPIMINSADNPVRVSWELNSQSITASLIIGGKEISLRTASETKINNQRSEIILKLIGSPDLPKKYALEQNYPNPFNPTTTIQYALPVDSKVTLKIYNVLGQTVATLVGEVQDEGYKSVEWDAGGIASGVYFYRLEATSVSDPNKSFVQNRKMVVIK